AGGPDRARGGVDEPGQQVDQGGLAGAGGADDRRRASRLQPQGDVVEDGLGRSLEAEGGAVELDDHPPGGQLAGTGRAHDARLGGQDGVDALGRHGGARDEHEHHRGHEHRHEDLHEVVEEGDERADLHRAAVDAPGAEPHHGHRRGVHDEHDDREHQRHEVADAQAGVEELGVGPREALPLAVLPVEGPDHPHAGDLLPHHPVDPVDALLDEPEERPHAQRDEPHDAEEQRDDEEEQRGEADVLPQRHDDAADHHDRGHDDDREGHQGDHLDLLDVVRRAGDERGGAEPAGLRHGEALDAAEDGVAQVASHAHRGPGAEVAGADRAGHLDAADEQHDAAAAQDVADVPDDDAVVDDVGVQAGQGQSGDRLDELQDDDDEDVAAVRTQEAPQDGQE